MFLVIQDERLICTAEVQDTNEYIAPSCSNIPFCHLNSPQNQDSHKPHTFKPLFLFSNSFPVSSLFPTVFFFFLQLPSAASLPLSSPSGEECQDYCPARQHSVSCQKSNWCWSYFNWSANAVGLFVLSICTVQNSF